MSIRIRKRSQSQEKAADGADAAITVPGGGKTRFALSNGRVVHEGEVSPIARAMIRKNTNTEAGWPADRDFVSDYPGHEEDA